MFSPCWIVKRGSHLIRAPCNPFCVGAGQGPLAAFPLHDIALWTFIVGAALLWGAIHLKRNARICRIARECEALQTRIRDILQHSREALFRLNLSNGQFDYLSSACLSLTGYTAEEIKTMGSHELLQRLHPEDREKMYRLIDQLRHSAKERDWLGLVDYRFRHRDGQYRFLTDHLHVAYDEEGSAAWLSGSARDVTQIVRLEENMRILEKKFQDSRKMAGLGLLAGGIAHDFNNLMTVVLGNAELALLECGGSDGGVLDEIKEAALRAAGLANQMLVYTGKTPPVISSINLSSVVEETGSLLDVSISKTAAIQYCLNEHISPIRGDIFQIRQVVINLITNASEAIGGQPGVITISTHDVELRAGELERTVPPGGLPAGRYVRLEVSGTGDGLNEETMQKIFDPQFNAKITGRGPGAASLLNVVQRHNGAVEVSREEGRGTVFRIYFPAELQAGEAGAAEAPETDGE